MVSLVSLLINNFQCCTLSLSHSPPPHTFPFQVQLHFHIFTQFQVLFQSSHLEIFSPFLFFYLDTQTFYRMDVFIPEEYVIRRRLEKKTAAACGKGSKSHSHRNGNRSEATENKASSSSTKGFGLVGDNVVFTCLSA